ncbi:hypothetical protein [Streptomyces violascens]|uniref:hypothetical protein n=1 Tax=Streptomyces violascens TaxID=67381 RepID=UPI0016791FC9|nr:hypothetical protein [Streptomyces violascens]GGU42986.1 hypothetical protein GCM10010289_74740 [Streptomyces violascens]
MPQPTTGHDAAVQAAGSATRTDMRRDIEIAMALAVTCPNGAVAAAVRGRLRGYISGLAEPAGTYVHALKSETRDRDIAEGTLRHAKNLLHVSGSDPAARLRLLAKGVDHLMRYAAQARAEAERP